MEATGEGRSNGDEINAACAVQLPSGEQSDEAEERSKAEAEGYVRAASVAEVKAAPSRKWKCLQVEKRSVTFFHQDDHIYALDRYFYLSIYLLIYLSIYLSISRNNPPCQSLFIICLFLLIS
jgi:hypothetical protein